MNLPPSAATGTSARFESTAAGTSMRDDLRAMVADLADYRELMFSMARRDFLLRYKQAVMGIGWAILMPVTYTLIFTLVFARVVKLETGMPYPLYAYIGLLGWNLFASSVRFSVNALVANSGLITKVYFPREVLPFSVVLVSLLDFAVGTVILAGLLVYYHVGLHPQIVLLPVILVTHVAFTAAIALLVSMGNLFYRDVKYLIEIVLTFWMFATSVVYPVSRFGGKLASVLALNPMTPILDAYRSVLVRGEWPAAGPLALAAAISLALLFVCWLGFHRAESQFAERI
jgi:ABC-type polysaccharide/polyol phosphate export permease